MSKLTAAEPRAFVTGAKSPVSDKSWAIHRRRTPSATSSDEGLDRDTHHTVSPRSATPRASASPKPRLAPNMMTSDIGSHPFRSRRPLPDPAPRDYQAAPQRATLASQAADRS